MIPVSAAPPPHYRDTAVTVRKLPVGPLENNAYLVVCNATGHAVLVDAAAEPERLLAAADDVTLEAIVTTHGHWDHVQAVPAIVAATGVPFRLHPADAELAGREPDLPLEEGVLQVGALRVAVLSTPGHTPGSVCLALPGLVLTGDTLFPGGPGATRDPDAFDRIVHSLEKRLFTLPDDTLVLPGHGLDTTIGAERPHLDDWKARGW